MHMPELRRLSLSDAMARAFAAGRKTETRRVITAASIEEFCRKAQLPFPSYSRAAQMHRLYWRHACPEQAPRPPYISGQTVLIAESHRIVSSPRYPSHTAPSEIRVQYMCDGSERTVSVPPDTARGIAKRKQPRRVLPPRYMRPWLCRYRADVVDVRCEFLHDITPASALAEGISFPETADGSPQPLEYQIEHALEAFRAIWDAINAKRGYNWDQNPLVWVYQLRHRPMPEVCPICSMQSLETVSTGRSSDDKKCFHCDWYE